MPVILDDDQKKKLRRKRTKMGSSVKPPKKSEMELRRRLSKLWTDVLFSATERIKQLIKDGASPSAVAEVLEDTLRLVNTQYAFASRDIIERWRMSVEKETRYQMNAGLRKALGVDLTYVLDSPEVKDALQIGGMEAANLIRTIPEEHLGRVARAVADNFAGRPLPGNRSLLEQIVHIGDMSENRAKLIARDQTSKLTGLLNQTRQQSIGIETYIWRTVKDSRVVGNPNGLYPDGSKLHGDHYMMEGLTCRWDDSTVYSLDKGKTWINRPSDAPKVHPGMDIQCRCHAQPIIDIQRIIELAEAA